jgi:hypothetical protein
MDLDMSVERQTVLESNRNQSGHRATHINLHGRSQFLGANPNDWRWAVLSGAPRAGLDADKTRRENAHRDDFRDSWARTGDRSGTSPSECGRPRREGLGAPDRKLDAAKHQQQRDRPRKGELQDRCAALPACAPQRRLL